MYIWFIRWKQLKQGVPWMQASHDTDDIVNGTIWLSGQDDWKKVQHDFLAMWCQY